MCVLRFYLAIVREELQLIEWFIGLGELSSGLLYIISCSFVQQRFFVPSALLVLYVEQIYE